MDIFEKCRNFTRAEEVMNAGIYPYFQPLSGNDGSRVHMNGRNVIMIGSNNYLGLTHDTRVIEAAMAATKKYGARGRERYVYKDVGHSAQNIYLQAYALNIGMCVCGSFNDKKVMEVLKLSAEETPLYLIPLGKK